MWCFTSTSCPRRDERLLSWHQHPLVHDAVSFQEEMQEAYHLQWPLLHAVSRFFILGATGLLPQHQPMDRCRPGLAISYWATPHNWSSWRTTSDVGSSGACRQQYTTDRADIAARSSTSCCANQPLAAAVLHRRRLVRRHRCFYSHGVWPGNMCSLRPNSSSTRIIVGDGSSLPVTHYGTTQIPTTASPLVLDNILISPSLIKNLISVRALTRDNPITIEFDKFGFSVKDLYTKTVILCSDSAGDLYPLQASTSSNTHCLTAITADLWHQRLGHPGRDSFHQMLRSSNFSCNKICLTLVMHVVSANMFTYLFVLPVPKQMLLLNLYIVMCGPLRL